MVFHRAVGTAENVSNETIVHRSTINLDEERIGFR